MSALLPGKARDIVLREAGARVLTCPFSIPCGGADVIVLPQDGPVHALSEESGHFRMEVPAGASIEVHAWHPLFQEAKTNVEVRAGQTVRVELVVTPVAPSPSEAPAANTGV